MATETAHKFAQLPGFDTAPDVYETPDLDDDNTTSSTVRTSPPLPSEASNTSDEEQDDEEESFGVSRRRLYPERARSRFREQARGVETRGTDLSDRVDGRRKGYRVRRRADRYGYGDGYGDGEEEPLEAKITRLRREVEECKAEAERAKKDGGGGEEGAELGAVDALCKMLADVKMPEKGKRTGHMRGGSRSAFHDAPTSALPHDTVEEMGDQKQTLARISAFDSRLAALEMALGISSLDTVTDTDATSTPLLPTLTLLDQQVATLASATSLSAIEAAASRIKKLKVDAQDLAQLQQSSISGSQPHPKATATASTTSSSADSDTESETPQLLSSDDMDRLHTLYTLLSTLQSLSPVVPAVITRLRSLRALHSTAATASAEIEALEQHHADMDKELKMWKDALQKTEEAVKLHAETNGRNGGFVQAWVEDLEARLAGLGGR